MIRCHHLLASFAAAALAAPATIEASPLEPLYNFTAQIRAQAEIVDAQARATFEHCPRGRRIADDLFDELEDLCRELDRIDEHLQRDVVTRHTLRRLGRLAHRLEEHACRVDEEACAAIEAANRRAAFRANPIGTPAHLAFANPLRAQRPSGAAAWQVRLAGGALQLHVGRRPFVSHPLSHRVAAGPDRLLGPQLGFGPQDRGVPAPQARALRRQTKSLRVMAEQFAAIVCG